MEEEEGFQRFVCSSDFATLVDYAIRVRERELMDELREQEEWELRQEVYHTIKQRNRDVQMFRRMNGQ